MFLEHWNSIVVDKKTIFASSKFLVYTLDLDGEGIKTEYFARVALFLSLFFPNPLANTLSFHSHLSFFWDSLWIKSKGTLPLRFWKKVPESRYLSNMLFYSELILLMKWFSQTATKRYHRLLPSPYISRWWPLGKHQENID